MSEIMELLQRFGLTKNEAEVYLLLAKTEWITVLDLSRKITIKRSTLYRILEALQNKGLVEIQVDDKTTYYKAATHKTFESIVTNKETEVNNLKSCLDDLALQLRLLTTISSQTQTTVRFYRGKAGVQALEWKMCEKPKTELWIFGCNQWFERVSQDFAEQIRQERVIKKIISREILNPQNADKTAPDGTTSWTKNKEYALKHYLHRYINEEVLDIQNEINLSETTIYLYSFQKDEMVGIEIVNPGYARLMRQLFKLVWNQAKPVDEFGGENL